MISSRRRIPLYYPIKGSLCWLWGDRNLVDGIPASLNEGAFLQDVWPRFEKAIRTGIQPTDRHAEVKFYLDPNAGAGACMLWYRLMSYHVSDETLLVHQYNGTGVGRNWLYISNAALNRRFSTFIGGAQLASTRTPALCRDYFACVTWSAASNATVDLYNGDDRGRLEQWTFSNINPEACNGNHLIGRHKNFNTDRNADAYTWGFRLFARRMVREEIWDIFQRELAQPQWIGSQEFRTRQRRAFMIKPGRPIEEEVAFALGLSKTYLGSGQADAGAGLSLGLSKTFLDASEAQAEALIEEDLRQGLISSGLADTSSNLNLFAAYSVGLVKEALVEAGLYEGIVKHVATEALAETGAGLALALSKAVSQVAEADTEGALLQALGLGITTKFRTFIREELTIGLIKAMASGGSATAESLLIQGLVTSLILDEGEASMEALALGLISGIDSLGYADSRGRARLELETSFASLGSYTTEQAASLALVTSMAPVAEAIAETSLAVGVSLSDVLQGGREGEGAITLGFNGGLYLSGGAMEEALLSLAASLGIAEEGVKEFGANLDLDLRKGYLSVAEAVAESVLGLNILQAMALTAIAEEVYITMPSGRTYVLGPENRITLVSFEDRLHKPGK